MISKHNFKYNNLIIKKKNLIENKNVHLTYALLLDYMYVDSAYEIYIMLPLIYITATS